MVDRPLNWDEKRVLEHLLSAWPGGASYRERLDSMRVVDRCSCGCVSVNLRDKQRGDPNQPSLPLPVEGRLLAEPGGGVLVFANEAFLTYLEAFSLVRREPGRRTLRRRNDAPTALVLRSARRVGGGDPALGLR